jgi:hypothetical protein
MAQHRWPTRWAAPAAGVVLAIAGMNSTTAFAQTVNPAQAIEAGQAERAARTAQAAAPGDSASMVKPPESAEGPHGSSDPDNMPIKRPDKATNDKMSRTPPASGANAK